MDRGPLNSILAKVGTMNEAIIALISTQILKGLV